MQTPRFMQRAGRSWPTAPMLSVLLGLTLLWLWSCSNGGESGRSPSQSTPSPTVERQAVEQVLDLYRTAILQEDIDRLQALFQPEAVAPSGVRRQEAGGALTDVPAFLEAMRATFRTRTILGLEHLEADFQLAADLRSAAFLEVESAADPVTLAHHTRLFRTTLHFTREVDAQGVITFPISSVQRHGPLVQVTSRGQVVAGALTRLEVTAGTWPLVAGKSKCPRPAPCRHWSLLLAFFTASSPPCAPASAAAAGPPAPG